MKRTILIAVFAVLLVVAASSCKKIITALFPGIDVKVPDIAITIPPVPIAPPNEMLLGNYSIPFNLDSIIRAKTGNTFNINDIRSVKVKEVTVALQNGDNLNNLSNFETARMTMSSNTDGIERDIITFNFPDVMATTNTLTPTNGADIKSYLTGNTLHFNVYGKLRRPTTRSLNMIVSVTVRVD